MNKPKAKPAVKKPGAKKAAPKALKITTSFDKALKALTVKKKKK